MYCSEPGDNPASFIASPWQVSEDLCYVSYVSNALSLDNRSRFTLLSYLLEGSFNPSLELPDVSLAVICFQG
jgi:hypothetical protein